MSDTFDWPRPTTAEDLHQWIQQELDLVIPTRALIDGHSAPFEYLAHAFFDGGVPDSSGGLPVVKPASPDSVVWANRGGGKTFLAAVATLLDLVFKPTIEVRVLAGSLDQAKRMHQHLRGLLELPNLAGTVDGRITDRRARLKNGSNVELLSQSQRSVRGTRVQKLRCDEVELFDPEVWEAAQLVTRSKDCGGVWVPGTIECLSTMHVPYGLMWRLVRESTGANEPADGDKPRTLFKWGVVDVLGACDDRHDCETCSLHTDCGGRAKQRDADGHAPGHVEIDDAVTMRSRVSEATWAAEMLSLRPSRRDSVLPEFDRDRHVISARPPADGDEVIAGMDFGMRAPTVIIWAVCRADGAVHVIAERSVAGAIMERHTEAILQGQPDRRGVHIGRAPVPEWIGVDPAGRQRNDQTGLSNVQVLRKVGLRVRDRRMALAAGIEVLRTRLAPAAGEPTLFIDPACETLIESIERYRYASDRPESEEPLKDGADHAVDALRYMVQNLDAGYAARAGRY